MLVYQRVFHCNPNNSIINGLYYLDPIIHYTTGWWLTYPSEKYEFVSWDDDIPNIWKNKIHAPNHQAVFCLIGQVENHTEK